MRTVSSFVFIAFALNLFPYPALSQESVPASAESIQALEKKLDEIEQAARALRLEIDEMKRRTEPSIPPTEELDLTAIEPIPSSPDGDPAADTTPPDPSDPPSEPVLDTTPVTNAPAPGASKVFNPDISVVGNFVGHLGDENPFEERKSLALEEAELALEAFVDPYARARFFIAASEEGVELEEGYITFIDLPKEFGASVGKLKASFGKVNRMHLHNLPWIDRPLVLTRFFGDEGLADSGVSVTRLLPTGQSLVTELTAEVFSGNAEGVFETQQANDLFYLAHLKLFRDLTENSNLEFGTSYARGTTPEVGGTNQFAGVDVTFRWKPLSRAIYRSFVSRTEIIANDRESQDDRALGFYSSADYQLARRWYAGARIDSADRPDEPGVQDRGASLTLTFRPSEFSQIRGQLRRTRLGGLETVNEFLLQVEFAIGAHGAHTF